MKEVLININFPKELIPKDFLNEDFEGLSQKEKIEQWFSNNLTFFNCFVAVRLPDDVRKNDNQQVNFGWVIDERINGKHIENAKKYKAFGTSINVSYKPYGFVVDFNLREEVSINDGYISSLADFCGSKFVLEFPELSVSDEIGVDINPYTSISQLEIKSEGHLIRFEFDNSNETSLEGDIFGGNLVPSYCWKYK